MNLRTLNTVLYQNPAAASRVAQHVQPWKRSSPGLAPPRLSQEQAADLPAWIRSGAHLCYRSRSSGKNMEVIVEKVSQMKQEVKITFAEDPDVWKGIPFTMVLSRANPLLGPWMNEDAKDPKQQLQNALREQPDKSELIRRLQESEADGSQVPEGPAPAGDDEVEVVNDRSRSPRR